MATRKGWALTSIILMSNSAESNSSSDMSARSRFPRASRISQIGNIGGEPKCCKSFLALDLAVSVAAGVPCLRRFAVPSAGRVLLYAAEDALHIVRRRLDGICAAAGLGLADLDVQVITAPTVRLDLEADRRSLDATVAELHPRLLVLDPFVRLHRIDENASGEVAPLLAYLRELQRRHAIAVVVVHHAKKGAGHIRAGQALRGSSEFHAWGDSNLYLRRNRDPRDGGDITLTVEHRAAPAMHLNSHGVGQGNGNGSGQGNGHGGGGGATGHGGGNGH